MANPFLTRCVHLHLLSNGSLEYSEKVSMKVWNVLSHVVNHGTAHRAQI